MSENKFKTKVKVEVSYDSEKPEGFEYDSREDHANIEYFVSIDMREWGIKDISTYASAQDVELNLQLQSNKDEDSEEYTFKIEIEEINVETDDVSLNSGVCPKELTLDLKDIKKIGPKLFTASAKGILIF